MTVSTIAVDSSILRLVNTVRDLYELHANGNTLGVRSDIIAPLVSCALDAVESAMEQLYDSAGEVAAATGSKIANEIDGGDWRSETVRLDEALKAAEERCARTRRILAEYSTLRDGLLTICRTIGAPTTEDAIAAATPGPVDMTFEEAVGS